jgi:hypothetical protein
MTTKPARKIGIVEISYSNSANDIAKGNKSAVNSMTFGEASLISFRKGCGVNAS